jgi:hypothetical protein
MFVGFNRGDRFAQMERELGRPLGWVVTMLDSRSPSAMRSSAWGQFASNDAYLPKAASRLDVVVTVPLAFGSGGQTETAIRANLRDTAAGRWDNDFRAIADYVKAAGYGDAVIRLGHEADDAWPPYSSRNNTAAYIAAFRHVHDVLSAKSPGFRFDWASTRAGFSTWGLPAYPGDAYVDVIGLDTYWRDASIPDRDWTMRYEPVLREHLEFARSRNKPVSFPEWGQGFHNTGRYIELMNGWFRSLPTTGPGRLLYQSYFNDPTQPGYNLDNYPTTKQAYINTFKSSTSGTTTTTTVRPTTTTTTVRPTTTTTTVRPTTTTTTVRPTTTTTTVRPTTTTTTVRPSTTTTVRPATTTPALLAPPASTVPVRSVFSAGSATEASLRLTWVDSGLRVAWGHPSAKLYNVRYRQAGSTGWTWLGTVGSSKTSTTFALNPSRAYTVEVIAYVSPAWRTWNSATINAAQTTAVPRPAAPPAGTDSARSTFSPGSDTEASLRLTWVDSGLRVAWEHPSAKLYIVRHQKTGSPWWTWLGTVGSSKTSTTLDLDPSGDYTVEVIAYVSPAWRTWNSATIQGTPG